MHRIHSLCYTKTGTGNNCQFDQEYKVHGTGCNNYVLIIQDKEAYPDDPDVQLGGDAEYYLNQIEGGYFTSENKSGWKYIPDVFLSGSVHGNERVGPTSLIEMAELLVESAYCESLPRMKYRPSSSNEDEEVANKWKQELMSAKTCRDHLEHIVGVPSPYRQWLARLVSTRRTVIIPTANALGYSQDERTENGIDPNRDFPFDIKKGDEADCMQTTAGRSINELFRSHLFPIGLTFHGGMEVIGYEWGAPTYLHKDAPDAIAQNAIASAYSRYANGFPGHVPYDFGTMNDKVYYVRGGMEDWAFAGSWDPDRVVQCQPKTFGGYAPEKTTYNNSTLRAFNMLIETSDNKTPSRDALGDRTQPLVSTDGKDNGHIARNIRLALLAMDVVDPYVSIRGVGGMELEDDVVPGVNIRQYNGKSHFDNTAIFWVPGRGGGEGDDGSNRRKMKDQGGTKISWTIGGAMSIDYTELVVGPWDALPLDLADVNDGGTYPSAEMIASINSNQFVAVTPSNVDSNGGRSRWHAKGPHPLSSDGSNVIDPTFEAVIGISDYRPGTILAVIAKTQVDKDWLDPASDHVGPSDLGPISHIVNARHNPSYFATNAGKIIRGHADSWFYSVPITLIVGNAEEEVLVEQGVKLYGVPATLSDEDGGVMAAHINARQGYLSAMMDNISRPPPKHYVGGSGSRAIAPTVLSMPWLLGAALCVAAVVVLVLIVRRRRRKKYSQRKQLERMAEDEEDSFSVGSYRDDNGGDEDEDPKAVML